RRDALRPDLRRRQPRGRRPLHLSQPPYRPMSALAPSVTIASEPAWRRGLRGSWLLFRRVTRTPLGAISMAVIFGYVLVALLAPVIAPYSPDATQLAARLRPPSAEHWLGTDALGRDIFSRVLYGARVSLLIGVI